MYQLERHRSHKPLPWALGLIMCLGVTGCAGDYSGQSLPSPYYLSDDVQYFPPGPEFKLTREAAAQKEYRETEALREGTPAPGHQHAGPP